MNAEDERSYCRSLTSAFNALSLSGRVLLMKHMIEKGPVTLDEAVSIVGEGLALKPSRKTVLADLRAMVGAGLARHVTDRATHTVNLDTWRAAQSCVANAVRRALVPTSRVASAT